MLLVRSRSLGRVLLTDPDLSVAPIFKTFADRSALLHVERAGSKSPLPVQSRWHPGVSGTNGSDIFQVPSLQFLDRYPGQDSLLDTGGAAGVQYRLSQLQAILSILIDQNDNPPIRSHEIILKAQGVAAKSG